MHASGTYIFRGGGLTFEVCPLSRGYPLSISAADHGGANGARPRHRALSRRAHPRARVPAGAVPAAELALPNELIEPVAERRRAHRDVPQRLLACPHGSPQEDAFK